MGNPILPPPAQRRKLRGLRLTETGAVTPNGTAHQYYVRSTRGGCYVVATERAGFSDVGKCNCPDFRTNGGLACKHVWAARAYERSEEFALHLCNQHDLTPAQLETRLLADLCHPQDELTGLKLAILLAATRRLQEAQP
jgi:hypothetical protein